MTRNLFGREPIDLCSPPAATFMTRKEDVCADVDRVVQQDDWHLRPAEIYGIM